MMILNPYRFAAAGGGGDPFFANVSLLMHFDGTNGSTTFVDNSGTPKTSAAVGEAKLSTAWAKFGTASAIFDGDSDYIRITSGSTSFEFDTGDFTIEFVIRPIVVSAGNSHFLYDSRGGAASNCPQVRINTSGLIEVLNSGSVLIMGTTTVVADTEYAVSVARIGTSLRMFVNGIQEGSTVTNSTSFTVGDSSTPVILGTNSFNPAFGGYNGYMDELRVTKGVGRYSANYTPATAAFPDS